MTQTIAYLPGLSPVENEELAKSIDESTVHTGVARPSRHCHVWTPPVMQGENLFGTAVELAVMYPAFSLRYADRWP